MPRQVSAIECSKVHFLRQNMLDAERVLWRRLQAHHFYGHSFRRKALIGGYVVDFVCPTTRLVVEIDGGASDFAYDRLRDQTLWRLGYRTIRFCNLDVLDNPEGVLAVLSLEMER